MQYAITTYDDHGAPFAPKLVDLPTLQALLARAAVTGERLHIRPRNPRARPAATERKEIR
ncbi:hypothetical protein ACFWIQ_34685 [Kitasatospora sp. NPDC127059]|uniref:hypothetical protein n=1 Tax=unclassified Kitasatospora TaxID=2633591 RepID=UPI0036612F8E